jgi:hypothetical protein
MAKASNHMKHHTSPNPGQQWYQFKSLNPMEHQHPKIGTIKVPSTTLTRLYQVETSDHTYRHSFKIEMDVTINIQVPKLQNGK